MQGTAIEALRQFLIRLAGLGAGTLFHDRDESFELWIEPGNSI